MPRYIVKIDQYYMEWSSVTDAPVTNGMVLRDFKEYYLKTYGDYNLRSLDVRLERVEKQGTSCFLGGTLEEFLETNRAGALERRLTKEEIIAVYCLEPGFRVVCYCLGKENILRCKVKCDNKLKSL